MSEAPLAAEVRLLRMFENAEIELAKAKRALMDLMSERAEGCKCRREPTPRFPEPAHFVAPDPGLNDDPPSRPA